MTELDLRETLERHLDAMDVPPAPLGPVVVQGRRRRRRRQAVIGIGVTGVLVAVAASGAALMGSDDQRRGTDSSQYASLGPLDFSQGARAYADPGRELHLAGRTFPAKDLDYLDTDAVATSYGMVFFDHGRPMLLGADGDVEALVTGPLDDPKDFHPTAKWDPVSDQVAWATVRDGTSTLTVYDLARREVVREGEAPGCDSGCRIVIDAIDDGNVVVRKGDGSYLWSEESIDRIGGPDVRVADLRGGVLLWSGAQPDAPGYRLVEGAIDAQLTFDGKYVLDWSSRLRSTDGSPDLVLEQGPTKQYALGFWAIDSDGSVLVARPDGDYPHYLVYDCDAASGACEELGPLVTKGGDPMFIGADM
jgi:hypothetical protein